MRRALIVLALSSSLSARSARGDAATDTERARQLAAVLGLEPQLERIVHAPPPATVQDSVAHMGAVEDAIVALSRAGLELDSIRAQLLHEQFEAKTAHDIIQKRYENSVERWSIAAVLVGSGVGAVGTSLQFGDQNLGRWGDGVTLAGSVLARNFRDENERRCASGVARDRAHVLESEIGSTSGTGARLGLQNRWADLRGLGRWVRFPCASAKLPRRRLGATA